MRAISSPLTDKKKTKLKKALAPLLSRAFLKEPHVNMPRGVALGSSRRRNGFSLKAELKRRKQKATVLNSELRGVQKRRADLRETLADANALVGTMVAQARQSVVKPSDISGKSIGKEYATRLERVMRKQTNQMSAFTTKVTRLISVLTREDRALAQSEEEMRVARRSAKTFVDDTLRIVNDIAGEVAMVRADVTDNLADSTTTVAGDNPFVVSTFFHLHTRRRDTAAAGIFHRRRGAAVRRGNQTAAITGPPAQRAIKAADASTPHAIQ